MTTISGTPGASSAWSALSTHREAAQQRRFAKVDTDGSGQVDQSELQGLLDTVAERTGGTAMKAADVLGKMDADGNGTLDSTELDDGMKQLMPAPSSTVAFAQQSGRPPGPPPGEGPPPGGGGGAADGTAATSTSKADLDPLDTNEDGTVSATERAAGELKRVLEDLLKAADSDGDQAVSAGEADTLKSQLTSAFDNALKPAQGGDGASTADASTSGDTASKLSQLVIDMLKQYAGTASEGSASTGTSVSTTA